MKQLILTIITNHAIIKEAQLSLAIMNQIGPGSFDSVEFFRTLDELLGGREIGIIVYNKDGRAYNLYVDKSIKAVAVELVK